MKMKIYIAVLALALASCGGAAQRRVTYVETPDKVELNETKQVKTRTRHENKKRSLYYNSLQYKSAYKQF